MIFDTVKLNNEPEGAVLDLYVPDIVPKCAKRDAILVIPGGGYGAVCSDREGEPVAEAFLPYGFAAFVLKYSIGKKALFPRPLVECGLAIRYIRNHAEEFGIDPDRIFVTGFSAGGHLTASIGSMWNSPQAVQGTDMKPGENKPKGCIPVYPLISTDPKICPQGCCTNFLGYEPDVATKETYSVDQWVDGDTVPMFIVHTFADQLVPVQHSLLLAEKLAENKIPFEIHVFQDGPHGISISNGIVACGHDVYDNSHNASWVRLAAEWAKNLK